ncbi:sugar nucleotide-binding protein [bacterium]|nr:sugar nucleotide-binding protein [bacterium]
MRILLTGSNGLLGQKLIGRLSRQPAVELIATARGENRAAVREGYRYCALDITDRTAVLEAFEQFRPDSVIHTAAMTHVDQCEQQPEACTELNVQAVAHLVEACAQHACHLVHLSTDFIFDGSYGPLDESAQPAPLSVYGHSKLKAEELVQSGLTRYAIVRTMLVYGLADEMSRSNIVLWAIDSLSAGKPIKVVHDQFRSPTWAEDLAEGCILAALSHAQGIYHISGAETLSILDFVRSVARFWNLDESLIEPIDSASLGQPARRPPRTGFIIDKARTELGFQPHSLEEAFALIRVQLEQRSGRASGPR